jgi:outer membrane PBP1 activator LpoA protein
MRARPLLQENKGQAMRAAIIMLAALALAGCQTTPPEVQTRVISVPSSAPYDFIHYTDQTDEATAKKIRKHNRSHAAVIAAEQKAKQ